MYAAAQSDHTMSPEDLTEDVCRIVTLAQAKDGRHFG